MATLAMATNAYRLDAYVLDVLMRDLIGHDRKPSAFAVYLSLVAAEAAGGTALSHAQLAERTGLSRRSVQDAVRHLKGRGLLRATRPAPSEPARYEPLQPWRRV
jgi:DNA-binding GntR family transcriptional regulator